MIIGLGGGLFFNIIYEFYFEVSIENVEIDFVVIKVVCDYFSFVEIDNVIFKV